MPQKSPTIYTYLMTKVGPCNSIYGLHDKIATVALLPVALLLGDRYLQ